MLCIVYHVDNTVQFMQWKDLLFTKELSLYLKWTIHQEYRMIGKKQSHYADCFEEK